MYRPSIWITPPLLVHGTDVWFSAYGFGWGYRAFAISLESVRTSLGAADSSDEQFRLAFQLGTQTLLRAIREHNFQPYAGERIWLALEPSIRPTSNGHCETSTLAESDEASTVEALRPTLVSSG